MRITQLADEVGVSCHTVYNEIGSTQSLAGATVLDTELLPLLTTHPQATLDSVKVLVAERLELLSVPLEQCQVDGVIDIFVRAVLIHVVQPGGDPQDIAEDIARLIDRIVHRETWIRRRPRPPRSRGAPSRAPSALIRVMNWDASVSRSA